MMTAGVAALENPVRNAVVEKIKAFDAFDDDNDPWGEHDFVSVELDGQTSSQKSIVTIANWKPIRKMRPIPKKPAA